MGDNLVDSVKDYIEDITDLFESIYEEYKNPDYSKDELLCALEEALRKL